MGVGLLKVYFLVVKICLINYLLKALLGKVLLIDPFLQLRIISQDVLKSIKDLKRSLIFHIIF
jgi:hypothetical protein